MPDNTQSISITDALKMAYGKVHTIEQTAWGTIALFYDDNFRTHDGYYVVIGHREHNPFPDSPFFTAIWKPELTSSWFSGDYDLKIDDAIKSRKRRSYTAKAR